MTTSEMKFIYASQYSSVCEQEDFVLRIPAGIRSKVELLQSLANAGRFPEYFGRNWDALLDCLRDLSWISNKAVVIVHSDLPLRDNAAECRTYLEVLQTALSDWARGTDSDETKFRSEEAGVDHEMQVVFPSSVKVVIESLVARR